MTETITNTITTIDFNEAVNYTIALLPLVGYLLWPLLGIKLVTYIFGLINRRTDIEMPWVTRSREQHQARLELRHRELVRQMELRREHAARQPFLDAAWQRLARGE